MPNAISRRDRGPRRDGGGAGGVAVLAVDARLGGWRDGNDRPRRGPRGEVGPEGRPSHVAHVPLLTLLTAAAAVAALLAILYSGLARHAANGPAGVNAVGAAARVAPRPAPPIVLPLLAASADGATDGVPFRLDGHRGHIVVVNFWASWCAPCRDEATALERGWQQWGAAGTTDAVRPPVQFVGINLWDSAPAAKQFLQQVGASYPIATDATGETAIAYGVRGLPETFFVDATGQLVRKWIGPIDERHLAATLEELGGRP